MEPLKYSIYKGMGGKFGAIQFGLQKSYYFLDKRRDKTGKEAFAFIDGKYRLKDGWKLKEGCIFVEITSSIGKNVYNWIDKIIMALSISDIGKLLVALKTPGELSIMHDPNARTKSQNTVKKILKCKLSDQGALLSVTMITSDKKTSHVVPLSPSEVVILRNLLEKAVTAILSW